MQWKTDPTFYPSPKLAMRAPVEKLAYVAALNANGGSKPDALLVVDVDHESGKYGQIVGSVDMPNAGDELHHFGWNACSSALCPYAPHPHVERRYLIVPGLRSSRIHVIDTKPDPRQPKIVKVIEAKEVADVTGYSRPHTIHCGPDGIYLSALGAPNGDGPGGIFALDHYNFQPLGRWGSRSRSSILRIRLCMAFRSRRRRHQRMGHTEHGGGWRESRVIARG